MQLHNPLNPTTGLEDPTQLPWTTGVPATGQEGSFFGWQQIVEPMQELVNLILAAGLTPTSSDLSQVIRAIRSGQLDWDATDTGTADAIQLQIGLPHSKIISGLPFAFIKGPNSNSGIAPLVMTITDSQGNNPVTGQLLKAGGGNLGKGDAPGGALIVVRADANGNFRLVSLLTVSDIVQQIAATAPVSVKADATVWIRSDSTATAPDGSVNDQAHAFPTIAAARDYVKSRYFFASFNCIFRLGVAGNYAYPGAIVGVPNWQILGDPQNPQSYNITGASTGALVNCIGSNGQIIGCTITNTGSVGAWASVSNGSLSANYVIFASSGQTVVGSVMSAGVFGTFTRGQGCVLNGCNAAAVMSADGGRMSVTGILTLMGSSTIASGYLTLANNSTFITSIPLDYSVASGASLSGPRYAIDYFCKANINGANPSTYFPGGQAGTNNGFIG